MFAIALVLHDRSAAQGNRGSELSGLAQVSGTVTASQPFQAAKVYFRNTDKNVVYMVYTVGGRYQAMHLFPGNYEFRVQAEGLQSDVQKLTLRAGQNPAANATLNAVTAANSNNVTYLPYEELYPAGAGRVVAEKTCIRCHGVNFLPSRQWSAAQWKGAIDMMAGSVQMPEGTQIQPEDMSPQERQVLEQYLVANFGPESKPRALKVEIEMPVDETKLAKALYIEYRFPADAPGTGIHDPKYKDIPHSGPFSGRRVSQDVHFDKDGYVWVIDRGVPNRLLKLDPRTAVYKEFDFPEPANDNHDIMIDRNGTIWAPDDGMWLNVFNPRTEKFETRYALDPDNVVKANLKHPQSMALDSFNNVYVGMILGGALSKWNSETKKVSVYPLPTPNSYPYGVVSDTKDNIWIAEFHGSKIAKFDPKTEKFTEYAPPTSPALIRRLKVDAADNVWFGLFSAGKLVKLDSATGKMTEWKIPHQISQPYDVAPVGDHSVWISDAGQGGALIRFDRKTETFTYFPTPQRSDMPKIHVTRDGAVWYPPRSTREGPGAGVLYPDMTQVKTLAGYF
jgi:virginiamycin B lyase